MMLQEKISCVIEITKVEGMTHRAAEKKLQHDYKQSNTPHGVE